MNSFFVETLDEILAIHFIVSFEENETKQVIRIPNLCGSLKEIGWLGKKVLKLGLLEFKNERIWTLLELVRNNLELFQTQ